jgi:hypothetical protein
MRNCETLLYCCKSAAIIAFAAVCVWAAPPPGQCKDGTKVKNALRYRIGHKYRTIEDQPWLLIRISINPRHFNRADMTLLAQKLNKDFCGEGRFSAIIFDNYASARDFVFHSHSPTFERDMAAMRGGYNLDRAAGIEYVSFFPDPNKPRDEVKIEISNAPPR